jgi:hypothetical protein
MMAMNAIFSYLLVNPPPKGYTYRSLLPIASPLKTHCTSTVSGDTLQFKLAAFPISPLAFGVSIISNVS